MHTKKGLQINFNVLLLGLGASLGLYLIEIFDLLLSYEIFLDIPLILTLFGSAALFIFTFIQIVRFRVMPSIVSLVLFIILTTTYSSIYANRNGVFWGKKIIDATFLDDRSRMDLELYENGKFLIYSNWLFGENRFEGSYKLQGDTIYFEKFPVIDNDYISKEIIIDKTEKRIYFSKDKDGKYDKSFYYFQIDFE